MAIVDPKDIVTAPGGPFTLGPQVETSNTITCMAGGQEMLKVGPDGFWVRGVKVEQAEGEAKQVYEAFRAWMIWAQLNKEYK